MKTYLKLMALVALCAGLQIQAMQQPNEELELLNKSIAKYEAKKGRVGRLAQKDAQQLEAAKIRRDELERRHGLASAQAERSQLRQQQLQVLRQQGQAEQQQEEEPQSELRQQASVQTLRQPAGRQPLAQQPQQPQRQPRPRVKHEQSLERLKSLQEGQESESSQDDNHSYDSWDEYLQEQIDNQFAEDKEGKMKD